MAGVGSLAARNLPRSRARRTSTVRGSTTPSWPQPCRAARYGEDTAGELPRGQLDRTPVHPRFEAVPVDLELADLDGQRLGSSSPPSRRRATERMRATNSRGENALVM